ncbi:unnamed protein product [Calicophoron daubneyi]|uniref:Regulator of microtubule dynamics protein 1 n=1 Tax=Calicophoron daubneyi TaxID=300641 RepID=A0AAV2TPW9_CALDB
MEDVISKIDKLRNERNFEAAYKLIKDAIKNDGKHSPDLYWRYAAACRDMALTAGKKDKKIYKDYVMEGLEAAEEGVKLGPDNPRCNCWYGIFIHYESELEGIKKRIENSFKMKEYFQKALKGEPDYDVALHSMGRWCFEVTDLPAIQRAIAKTFFATPPTSTYEEGLEYLLKAEKHAAQPMPGNDLYLAKTYQRLKDKEHARHYCDKVLKFTWDDMETEEAKKEIHSIVKSL